MKKSAILLAEGFEEIEALTVVDILRRAGVKCDMCSLNGEMVSGSHDIKVKADIMFNTAYLNEYDVLILPGGMPGAANLRDNEGVIEIVKSFYKQEKIIAAICAAPIVLERAGIIKGSNITSHPSVKESLGDSLYCEEIVKEDGNIITSRGPATAIYFGLAILEKLGLNEKIMELKKGMLLYFVENKIRDTQI